MVGDGSRQRSGLGGAQRMGTKAHSEGAVAGALGLIPLGAYQALFGGSGLTLLYHVVSDEHLPHIRHLYRYKTEAQFERDLVYLKDNFSLISYEQFEAARLQGSKLPRNAALLTFDDGYAECFSTARPLLLKHGVPCVFFVTTDWLDNGRIFYRNVVSLCIDRMRTLEHPDFEAVRSALASVTGLTFGSAGSLERWLRGLNEGEAEALEAVCTLLGVDIDQFLAQQRPYLTKDEVERLAAEGFCIGAHSRSHPRLSLLSDEEIEQEIVGSCELVADITKGSSIPFAFPFNGNGLDRRFLREISERHPSVGLYFDSRGVSPDDQRVVTRVWADPPGWAGPSVSNLGSLIHAAYRDHAARLARSLPRGLARRVRRAFRS